MKYWKVGAAFFGALIIQASLLNLVSVGGYTPNLLLCLVIVFSFMFENEIYGVVFGAVFGLLYDICFSATVGPTAIALAVTAVVILIIREFANMENILNLWMVSLISIALFNIISWGLLHISGNPIGLIAAAPRMMWSGLYSMVVITTIYSILIRKVVRHRKDRYFR